MAFVILPLAMSNRKEVTKPLSSPVQSSFPEELKARESKRPRRLHVPPFAKSTQDMRSRAKMEKSIKPITSDDAVLFELIGAAKSTPVH